MPRNTQSSKPSSLKQKAQNNGKQRSKSKRSSASQKDEAVKIMEAEVELQRLEGIAAKGSQRDVWDEITRVASDIWNAIIGVTKDLGTSPAQVLQMLM